MEECSFGEKDRRHSDTAWVVTAASAPRCIVVFEHLHPIARREGAHELGLAEDDVNCVRERRYDRFAISGRVPPRQLLADGYWYDCPQCGTRIRADNPETPLKRVLVNSDNEVFCQPKCAIAHEPIRQERNERFETFKQRLQKRCPSLKFVDFYGGYPHRFDSARFEFPGGMFPGVVQEVEQGLRWCVSEVDAEAWQRHAEDCGLLTT